MHKKYLCCLVLLWISISFVWSLPARSVMNLTSLYKFRIIIVVDSIEASFLTDFYHTHEQTQNPLFLVMMNAGMEVPLTTYQYKGFGSDMIEVSGAFFKKYYAQKITVFNFYDLGFVYLSVKNAQNSQGFLQFMVPFGNLRYILHPKKWKK